MDPKLKRPPMDLNKWQATTGHCSWQKATLKTISFIFSTQKSKHNTCFIAFKCH